MFLNYNSVHISHIAPFTVSAHSMYSFVSMQRARPAVQTYFKIPHSSCGSPRHFHPDSHHLHHTSTGLVCSAGCGTGTHHSYIAVAPDCRWRILRETVIRNQQETRYEACAEGRLLA